MNKVKLDVMKPWITKKIAEFLKMDDDVVVEFVFNQLEEKVRGLEVIRVVGGGGGGYACPPPPLLPIFVRQQQSVCHSCTDQ